MKKIITSIYVVAMVFIPFCAPVNAALSDAVTSLSQKGSDADYTLLAPLPCIPSPERVGADNQPVPGVVCPGGDLKLQEQLNFKQYVQYVVNLLIAISAVAAVLMIVYGGFLYMTSSIPNVKSDGLSKVKNAVYGLLLVLCSYLIIRTIDPRFVEIPTTFVPKLIIDEKKLDFESSMGYLSMLEAEANKFKLNADEYGAELKTARESLTSLQSRRATLQQQLDQLINGPIDAYNDTDPAVQSLKVEIAKLDNQINETKSSITIAEGKALFNGVIRTAINDTQQGGYSGSTIMSELIKDESLLKQYSDMIESRLKNFSLADIDTYNDAKKAAAATLSLLKIDAIIGTADKNFTLFTEGTYDFVDVDGKYKSLKKSALIEHLNNLISQSKSVASTITDAAYQKQLQDKIKTTTEALTTIK